MAKLTTEEFIKKAREVHGDKYDYSKVEYLDNRTPVCIICPKHGEFPQTPTIHLQGSGCPKCGNDRTALRMTNEDFINKARAVHGDKYDYSKVQYAYNKIEVCIICPEHGEFWQKPVLHLSGCGCSICSGRKKMRTVDFVKKANEVHNNKYDYSKTEYKGNTEEVCIICPEHGEFWQRASHHLAGAGCKQCGFIKSSSSQTIWTKEKCYETARKYNDLTTFSKEDQVAYVKAVRNGWLNEYTWLDRKKLPNGYWTHNLVMAEAKKYSTSGAFKKDCPDRMSPDQARAFRDAVLNIVSQIPRGRVTTYGHIAALAGWPSHSRMVGRTLRYTPGAEKLPCHRVVNKEGRTAPGWSRQRTLLEEEGIRFKANGHVDMALHLWEPPME